MQTVVMDAAKWLEAVFTESEPVRPGETKSVTLPASDRFQLYSGGESYSVLAPPDAAEVTVRFQSSSAEEVDLYVRRGGSVRLEPGDSDETPRVHADFESTSLGATEAITINRESVPRLVNEVYFVGLAVPPTQLQIEGTLSVEVRRGGIVKAWPRALTFVSSEGSDPGLADGPAEPRDNRHGLVQDRFDMQTGSRPTGRNGSVRAAAWKRFPSGRTLPAWRTTLTGAR